MIDQMDDVVKRLWFPPSPSTSGIERDKRLWFPPSKTNAATIIRSRGDLSSVVQIDQITQAIHESVENDTLEGYMTGQSGESNKIKGSGTGTANGLATTTIAGRYLTFLFALLISNQPLEATPMVSLKLIWRLRKMIR
jgi:hypothetical protein